MVAQFNVAAGTVRGTDHVRAGKNNQDAWCVREGPYVLVAVVGSILVTMQWIWPT